LNEFLPLYVCFQECCQRDDLVEHFVELLDVGQTLLVGSNPQFLDCLVESQQQVRMSGHFYGVSGKTIISGFFSGYYKVRSGRQNCCFFYFAVLLKDRYGEPERGE
jgi:hypothetical protein